MVTKTDQEQRFFDLTSQAISLVNLGKRTPDEIDWLNNQLQRFKVRTTDASYRITVNYDLTVEEMVLAGKYDWSNLDINSKNFPKTDPHLVRTTVDIELVRFTRFLKTDEIHDELSRRGLRDATLPELLAFGEKYPEKQREFHIYALYSVCRVDSNGLNVPYLWATSSGRGLGLGSYERVWSSFERFATVRK